MSLSSSSSPSSSSSDIIHYYGKNKIINHDATVFSALTSSLLQCAGEASKNSSFRELKTELESFVGYILEPDSKLKQYQLELMTDSVVPYLNKMMGTRLSLDKSRFDQLFVLLKLLGRGEGSIKLEEHPAVILSRIDKVIVDINSKGGLWKSELAKNLDRGVAKQWSPILGKVLHLVKFIEFSNSVIPLCTLLASSSSSFFLSFFSFSPAFSRQ